MAENLGIWKTPKTAILKINNPFSVSALGNLEMLLLKTTATIDPYTIDKFTGDITAYEQDYDGYTRKTLTGITRVNTIQDGYLWLADDITFQALFSTVRYGLIIDKTTKDVIAIMDLGGNITFAGDITFDLNVFGFFGIKV